MLRSPGASGRPSDASRNSSAGSGLAVAASLPIALVAFRITPPERVAAPITAELHPLASTSGTLIGQIGVDRVGAGIEIVSFYSLTGSLDPLLFCRQLLTLGSGGEFLRLGLLPLCFKLPSFRVVAVFLRLASPLFGFERGPTPHDDDRRHDREGNDNDHDDDDNGHVHGRYTAPGFTWANNVPRTARTH